MTESQNGGASSVEYSCTVQTGTCIDDDTSGGFETTITVTNTFEDQDQQQPPPLPDFVIDPTSGPVATSVTARDGTTPCPPSTTTVTVFVQGPGSNQTAEILVPAFDVPANQNGSWSAQFIVPAAADKYEQIFVQANCNGADAPYQRQTFTVTDPVVVVPQDPTPESPAAAAVVVQPALTG